MFTYAVDIASHTVDTPVYIAEANINHTQVVTGPMPGNSFAYLVTHSIHEVTVGPNGFSVYVAQPPAGKNAMHINGFQIAPVPEPSTFCFISSSCLLLLIRKRDSRAGKLHVAGLTTPLNHDYLTINYTQASTAVATSSYLISPGVYVSGSLASLTSSDDQRLVVRPGIVFGTGDFPAVVTVTGTSALLDPNELCFSLEAMTSSAGLTQRIELYDYDSANWVIVDERTTTTTDSVVHASAPYDARRFVGNDETPSAYEVKARISYRQTGPVVVYPWSAGIDLTNWEVLN